MLSRDIITQYERDSYTPNSPSSGGSNGGEELSHVRYLHKLVGINIQLAGMYSMGLMPRTQALLDGIFDRRNPAKFQNIKRLGLMVADYTTVPAELSDEASGFFITEGDKVLSLGLPRIHKSARSRGKINQTLESIAEYITTHDLQPKYVMGATYGRMARAAQHFGFTAMYPPSDSIPGWQEDIEKGYKRYTEAGKRGVPMGPAAIIFLDGPAFVEMYGAASISNNVEC